MMLRLDSSLRRYADAEESKLPLAGFEYLPVELLLAILKFSDLKSLAALSELSPRFRILIRENAAVVCNKIVEQLILDLEIGHLFDLHKVDKWLIPRPIILNHPPSSPRSVTLPLTLSIQEQGVERNTNHSQLIPSRFDGIKLLVSPGPQFLYLLESQRANFRFCQCCINSEQNKIKSLEDTAEKLGDTILALKETTEDMLEELKRLSWLQHQLDESRKNILRHQDWLMVYAVRPVAQQLVEKVPEHLKWYRKEKSIDGGLRRG